MPTLQPVPEFLFYPHENGGAFLAPVPHTPPAKYTTLDMVTPAMETLLDHLHLLNPADADFVDYLYCWLMDGNQRMDWQSRHVLQLYQTYGFDTCARGWHPL